MSNEPKLTNIKVSVKCSEKSLDSVNNICESNNFEKKTFSNYIVFKNKFIFTVFKNKIGKNFIHINITKIKTFPEIKESLDFLSKLGFKIISDTLTVDNITGHISLHHEVVLKNFISTFNSDNFDEEIFISYNNEKFPGLFLKVKKNSKKIGTIIVFHSGEVVFVGCKTFENLQCLASLILALTKTN